MPFSSSKNTHSPQSSTLIFILNLTAVVIFGIVLLVTLKNPTLMKSAFFYTSYYIILALTVTWVLILINLKHAQKFSLFLFLRLHWKALLVSLILASIVFISVPKSFRVLSDETNLLSVAKSMTFYKHVMNITEGRWYYEMFWPSVPGSVEKRPFLFPFFTSIMHNILGYHIENVFILNFLVLWAVLFMLYLFIRPYLNELSAFASLILVVSQPIISLSATSASYELFNLLFLIISLISLRCFLNNPQSQSFLVLIVSLIMLANIRYESIIYLLIFTFMISITGYIKSRFFKESAWYLLMPFFFLPLIWQRVLMLSESDPNLKGGSWLNAFNLNNGLVNAGLFFKYIFNLNGSLGYPGVMNIIGVIALVICVITILANFRNSKDDNQSILLACLFSSMLVVFCLLILYQGGINDHPLNGRFYIPILVTLSIVPVLLLSKLFLAMNWSHIPLVIFALMTFIFYHPVAVEDKLTNNLMIIREYKFVDNFLKKQKDKNFLVICGRPGQLIVSNYGALYYWTANKNIDEILEQYKNHLYKSIYVVQSISYRTLQPFPDNVLDQRYKLEPVEEVMIEGSYFFRISRIKVPQ